MARGRFLELLRPDESGKMQTVCSVDTFSTIRKILPFRLTGESLAQRVGAASRWAWPVALRCAPAIGDAQSHAAAAPRAAHCSGKPRLCGGRFGLGPHRHPLVRTQDADVRAGAPGDVRQDRLPPRGARPVPGRRSEGKGHYDRCAPPRASGSDAGRAAGRERGGRLGSRRPLPLTACSPAVHGPAPQPPSKSRSSST